VLVEFVDLIFAVDSVPAIFAITTDPFIVYTSNIFAILGLRALYFALAAMIHRFKYLKYALALVLVFIGSKIFLVGIIGKIPAVISLSVTFGLIAGGVLVSLWKTRAASKAVWRIESARIIASVARMVRDMGLAEELAQDALVAALEHWPRDGVPDNPGAWLMTTRQAPRARPPAPPLHQRKHEALGARPEALRGHCACPMRGRPGCRRAGRHRRRPAAPDLHRLPPGAAHRGARGPDAALLGGCPPPRSRAPSWCRAHHRPAHRARQAHAHRRACALRGAARRELCRAWPRCWR
jgi:hypothetical protein